MKQMDDRSLEYLRQYIDVSERVKKCIENHAKKYKLNPRICAWYKDMDDFYSDWAELQSAAHYTENCLGIGYSAEEVEDRYDEGIKSGEFLWLPDGLGLVRFEM